ncbi:hypothetical protein MSPP1_001146 [Malassezia sp. CBS 17886]|nr:hypothetical protein MSPP1_001146 [Malassezia sp. CBS 17886]
MDEAGDVRERDWQNAQSDDFDRRAARDDEDGDRRGMRDGDDRRDDRDPYEKRPRDFRDSAPRGYDRDRAPPRGRHPPGPRASPTPSNILGAFGLSIRTTERDLEDEFGRVGDVEKVVIVYDARTGRSRGFGFVTMRDVEGATDAIKKLNNVDLHGRRIRVDYSSTSRPHDPTPGEYRGNPRLSEDRYARSGDSSNRGGGYYDRRDRDSGRYDDRRRGYYDDDRFSSRSRWGSGPDGADWRRRASPPPRSRDRSPPPRHRGYDDYADRRRGYERDRDAYDYRESRGRDSRDYRAPARGDPRDDRAYRAPSRGPRDDRDYRAPPRDDRDYRAPPRDDRDYRAPPRDDRDYRAPPRDDRDYRAPPRDDRDYRAPSADDRDYGDRGSRYDDDRMRTEE